MANRTAAQPCVIWRCLSAPPRPVCRSLVLSIDIPDPLQRPFCVALHRPPRLVRGKRTDCRKTRAASVSPRQTQTAFDCGRTRVRFECRPRMTCAAQHREPWLGGNANAIEKFTLLKAVAHPTAGIARTLQPTPPGNPGRRVYLGGDFFETTNTRPDFDQAGQIRHESRSDLCHFPSSANLPCVAVTGISRICRQPGSLPRARLYEPLQRMPGCAALRVVNGICNERTSSINST